MREVHFQDADFPHRSAWCRSPLEGRSLRWVPYGMPRLNHRFQHMVFFLYGRHPKTGEIVGPRDWLFRRNGKPGRLAYASLLRGDLPPRGGVWRWFDHPNQYARRRQPVRSNLNLTSGSSFRMGMICVPSMLQTDLQILTIFQFFRLIWWRGKISSQTSLSASVKTASCLGFLLITPGNART